MLQCTVTQGLGVVRVPATLCHVCFAEDLEASVVAYDAEGMTSHHGLCNAVAKLCGGDSCCATSQCANTLSRQQLRDLIYRRTSGQLFSPAAVISDGVDKRPPRPQKVGASMSATQTRLLNHFRTIAMDETGSFFAIPKSETTSCPSWDPQMHFIWWFQFYPSLILMWFGVHLFFSWLDFVLDSWLGIPNRQSIV